MQRVMLRAQYRGHEGIYAFGISGCFLKEVVTDNMFG